MSQTEFLFNGVKKRFDGKGDAWAEGHRILGPTFNMQDMDGFFGLTVFGANTGDRLSLEYVPDNYKNKLSFIREFALIGMFDRKASIVTTLDEMNRVSSAFYLWQCRLPKQPIEPKFFYVIGGQSPPWTMIEINIHDGEQTGTQDTLIENSKTDWMRVWRTLGLIDIRRELKKWIDPF